MNEKKIFCGGILLSWDIFISRLKSSVFIVPTEIVTMRKKCQYSEFIRSILSRIWTESRDLQIKVSVLSPNVGKYTPEQL